MAEAVLVYCKNVNCRVESFYVINKTGDHKGEHCPGCSSDGILEAVYNNLRAKHGRSPVDPRREVLHEQARQQKAAREASMSVEQRLMASAAHIDPMDAD